MTSWTSAALGGWCVGLGAVGVAKGSTFSSGDGDRGVDGCMGGFDRALDLGGRVPELSLGLNDRIEPTSLAAYWLTVL